MIWPIKSFLALGAHEFKVASDSLKEARLYLVLPPIASKDPAIYIYSLLIL